LLTGIDNILRELFGLQRLQVNPFAPDQPTDEFMAQTYQPRIDELSQHLEALVRKAEGIAKSRTQQFLWEQALAMGLEYDTSSLVISLISPSLDNTLFEDMLTTLGNGGHSGNARAVLAFTILLPPETTYHDASAATTDQTTPQRAATPRQQRIKQFLEEQFQHETDPEVLSAYLDVYSTMSQDQHGLVPAAQFWQQLETLRAQIAPDRYFNFRLQQAKLTDPDADYASLFREISSTPMTPAQRQSLLSILSNTLFMAVSPISTTTPTIPQIPEQNRQVLLQYMETGLATPNLQDRYSLYEYGNQVYAIELLKHREQAADSFYQRIVASATLEEQLALLLGAPMSGDAVLKKLQQNAPLRQKLENRLTQPNLPPEMRALLQESLNMLSGEPPMLSEPPVDAYGSPIDPQQSFTQDGSLPEPGSAPDSVPPEGQYPGY
jgi:hypothetical protein